MSRSDLARQWDRAALRLRNPIFAVSLINILLSATAFLKDVMLAAYLGTSQQADVFMTAFFLPDTAGNNLLATAAGTACVPVFSILYASGDGRLFKECVKRFTLCILGLSLAAIVVLYLCRDVIAGTFAGGTAHEISAMFVRLFLIMLPAALMFPVVTIGSSVLQAQNRFKTAALPPVVFNTVFFASALFACILAIPTSAGVYVLSVSILAAAFFMLAAVWIPSFAAFSKTVVKPETEKLEISDADGDVKLKSILKVFFPYLFILAASQGVMFVERYLASGLEAGSQSAVNYAFRLAQFPVWVFVAAVSSVILPSLSRMKGSGRLDDLKASVTNALYMVFLIALPLSAFLYFMRVPVISILLKHGAFDSGSVEKTSAVLAGFAISVAGQSVAFISLRFFVAVGRMMVPLAVFSGCAVINMLADLILVEKIGLSGIGYGASVGALLNAVLVMYFLNKIFRLDVKKLAFRVLKAVAACIPLSVLFLLSGRIWSGFISGNGFPAQVIYVGVTAAAGFGAYFAILRINRMH